MTICFNAKIWTILLSYWLMIIKAPEKLVRLFIHILAIFLNQIYFFWSNWRYSQFSLRFMVRLWSCQASSESTITQKFTMTRCIEKVCRYLVYPPLPPHHPPPYVVPVLNPQRHEKRRAYPHIWWKYTMGGLDNHQPIWEQSCSYFSILKFND